MQMDDFNWFVENYQSLYQQYGPCFLAISNKKVLGAYDRPRKAITEASKLVPIGEFIVQLCNGDESGYTNYIASTQISVI